VDGAVGFAPKLDGAIVSITLSTGDAVALGPEAKLACIERAGATPNDDARLKAPLAVAHGRPVTKLSLAHVWELLLYRNLMGQIYFDVLKPMCDEYRTLIPDELKQP
jgi:hypothetical protein